MIRKENKVDVQGQTEPISVEMDYFHSILIGGDQMTCARVRGAQSLRENSVSGRSRMEGLILVIEDWHAKVCFMQVCAHVHRYSKPGKFR